MYISQYFGKLEYKTIHFKTNATLNNQQGGIRYRKDRKKCETVYKLIDRCKPITNGRDTQIDIYQILFTLAQRQAIYDNDILTLSAGIFQKTMVITFGVKLTICIKNEC